MARATFGPLAWTLPVGLTLAAMTAWAWLMFAGITRSLPPACELMDRTVWAFVAAAASAGLLLPLTLIASQWLRWIVAAAGALLFGGLLWWSTAPLFPRFC